jgi:hypothetical protein
MAHNSVSSFGFIIISIWLSLFFFLFRPRVLGRHATSDLDLSFSFRSLQHKIRLEGLHA